MGVLLWWYIFARIPVYWKVKKIKIIGKYEVNPIFSLNFDPIPVKPIRTQCQNITVLLSVLRNVTPLARLKTVLLLERNADHGGLWWFWSALVLEHFFLPPTLLIILEAALLRLLRQQLEVLKKFIIHLLLYVIWIKSGKNMTTISIQIDEHGKGRLKNLLSSKQSYSSHSIDQ